MLVKLYIFQIIYFDMNLKEKDVKRFAVIFLVIILLIFSFVIIRPILLSIFAGLLLAYILSPVYNWLLKKVKNGNLAAAIIILSLLIIVLIPLWFVVPILAQQAFEVFKYLQTLDITSFVKALLPNASPQFLSQMAATFTSVTSKLASSIMNSLLDIFVQLPTLLINVVVTAFVLFFGLRDKAELSEFISGLSPLSKTKEQLLIQQFKDITNSIVYGQVIVGIVQGLTAGLGFLIFGIPNAFILTIIAIIMAIIPIAGAWFVWIPVTLYLLTKASPLVVILFLLYNILLTSTIDNIIRTYIISARNGSISTAVIIVGMMGGLYMYGFLGLIIGPLVLAYLIVFLKAYKEKEWQSLFGDE